MVLVAALVGLFFIPEPWNLVVVVVAASIEVGEVFLWIRFLRRYRIQTGAEAMVGKRAEVIDEHRVRVHGEIWSARSEQSVVRGQAVRITGVDGLTLSVEPLVDE